MKGVVKVSIIAVGGILIVGLLGGGAYLLKDKIKGIFSKSSKTQQTGIAGSNAQTTSGSGIIVIEETQNKNNKEETPRDSTSDDNKKEDPETPKVPKVPEAPKEPKDPKAPENPSPQGKSNKKGNGKGKK